MALSDKKDLERRINVGGPLVKGLMGETQGSLISMAGLALERITRERSELPLGLKLPERPMYLLDPTTRRLVMITNREEVMLSPVKSYGEQGESGGLFAEVVELDENGEPLFRLSTSEVVLPTGSYLPVAVGSNPYNLPPSHMEVTEDDGKKFVPWNIWLGNLQNWMNEVHIDPSDDIGSFLSRFDSLQKGSLNEGKEKVKQSFPRGFQRISERVAPVNMIFADEQNVNMLSEMSMAAGLFPVYICVKDLLEIYSKVSASLGSGREKTPLFTLWNYLPEGYRWGKAEYLPAVITEDLNAVRALIDSGHRISLHGTNFDSGRTYPGVITKFQEYNPIFSIVSIGVNSDGEPRKDENGRYFCPKNQEMYLGLLHKLKADLLLTMFVRGGSPIVK